MPKANFVKFLELCCLILLWETQVKCSILVEFLCSTLMFVFLWFWIFSKKNFDFQVEILNAQKSGNSKLLLPQQLELYTPVKNCKC